MSFVRFQQHHLEAMSLHLQSQAYQGRVMACPAGVWRLLIHHRPEDAHKSSWILTQPKAQDLQLHHHSGRLSLQATLASELLLSTSPFAFFWQGLTALGLISEPVRSLQQALPQLEHEEDLHVFKGHPVRDKLDGLSLGSGLTLSFGLETQDSFYGLGERTGFLNKRGRRWHNWSTDEFFHGPKTDPLYQSHPFVMLQRDGLYLGIYLDESWYSCFDLGWTQPDQWSIHTAGPTLDLYLIPGPSPAEVLARYTALVGKAPMPPLWALGQHQCRWSYPDQASVEAVAQQYRTHDLPLEALWLDIDYMQSYKVFTFSTRRFPEPQALTQKLAAQGIKTVLIVDPGVKQEAGYPIYEQGRALDAFIHNRRDEELVGEVWPQPVVWPDFTQPAVRQWWGEQHSFYLEQGIAGIWNDMNEPAAFKWPNKTLPLDARQGAYSHAEVHNLYGYLMSEATYTGLKQLQPERRPFVLTRAGCAGIQKYAWVWTGDNASYWEHLEMSVPMLLNLGLSGVPFVGADIGGFSADCDGELLAAWSWLGACYPLMRNHAGKGSRRQEPWQFGEPWLSSIREALRFRYSLLPYLYSLSWQATQDGLPLMRPLLLDFPQDPQVLQISDQFLLGPDLLVAPVTRPGQLRRLLYLPAGSWYDFWTGTAYTGLQWIQVEASWQRLPLFQRAGSAIPLQPPQLHSTDAHWPELCWQIVPAEHIRGQVYTDAGEGAVDGQELNFAASWQTGQLQVQTPTAGRQVRLRCVGFVAFQGAEALAGSWELELSQDSQQFVLA